MASPDATTYVDLTVFDKDAQEMFESAMVNLAAYLPEWEPREGHTEVLLLEAMALQVAETVFAINRVPGAIVEVLLRLYGIERDLGSPATSQVRFTFGDTAGYTVPAGTRIAVGLGVGDESVVFTTDIPVTAAAGSQTVDAAVTADVNTALINNTPAGTEIELLDSLSSVDRVDLVATITGGLDEEDDDTWFARGAQRFSRLTETLVLPRHFVAAALERPEVSRAFAVDNYNSGAGSGAAGSHPGYVAVAVYGPDGPVSAAIKAAMVVDFNARAQANLSVTVIDPTLNTVNVTASVTGQFGYTAAQVREFCRLAVVDFLSPQTWPFDGTLYRNDLISLLDRVEGVARVNGVSVPPADVTLNGVAPLVTAGTIDVTVTGL